MTDALATIQDERTALALLKAARAGMERVTTVEEAKDGRDKTRAIKDYLDNRNATLSVRNVAAVDVIGWERLTGAMLREMEKNPGGGDHRLQAATGAPTLADLGIEKTASHRWQVMAAVPEEIYQQLVQQAEVIDTEITSAAFYKLGRDILAFGKDKTLKQRDLTAPVRLHHCDAVTLLDSLEPASVDLLLTDPPYSSEWGTTEGFAEFVNGWLPLALSRVKPTGRAYICIGAYPDEIHAYMNASAGQTPALRQVLVWTYRNTMGPSPTHLYKLNWQAILYYVGEDAPRLESPLLSEQFSVFDINNAPTDGDRLHTWEKPEALAERLLYQSTQPGDTVLDPFAGTGIFLLTAASMGRPAIGCDNDPTMLAHCEARGLEVLR